MTDIPTIKLNNDVDLPPIGLGVYRSSPEDTARAVEAALKAGYRMIDTAAAYRNEEQVGAGIRASGVDRSEIFLQTKLWISDYGFDAALRGFDRSTRKLGFDTVDLYLLHQPTPAEFDRTLAARSTRSTRVAAAGPTRTRSTPGPIRSGSRTDRPPAQERRGKGIASSRFS